MGTGSADGVCEVSDAGATVCDSTITVDDDTDVDVAGVVGVLGVEDPANVPEVGPDWAVVYVKSAEVAWVVDGAMARSSWEFAGIESNATASAVPSADMDVEGEDAVGIFAAGVCTGAFNEAAASSGRFEPIDTLDVSNRERNVYAHPWTLRRNPRARVVLGWLPRRH